MSHVPFGQDDRHRTTQLRQRLALDRLPAELGPALVATAPDAQRLALRQLEQAPSGHLGPVGREAGRQAVRTGILELALLVADEAPPDPPTAVLLRRIRQAEPETPGGVETTEVLLTLIGTAIRGQIERHPALAAHTVALHTGLKRYLDHLRHAVPRTRSGPAPDPAADVPDDLAPFLYHHLREEFGRQVPGACVTVRMVGPGAAVPDHPGYGVLLLAGDHLAFLHPTTFLPTDPAPEPPATVHAGPVPPRDLVRTYQTAVLLARMVRLGWASASGPVHCHPHAPGDMSTVLPRGLLELLTPHLAPMLGLPLPHRIETARALHRVLAKPATLQQHAKALSISTATLRHRLAPLDPILGHAGPSPDHLIALASLLPALDHLWRAELLDEIPHPRIAEAGAAVPAVD